MIFKKHSYGAYLSAFSLFSVCFLFACAQPLPRWEPDNLFWPPPPDTPRIKYVRTIYSEDDLGRKYSFVEKIFGKSTFDIMVRPYGVYVGYGKLLVTDIVVKSVQVFSLAEKRLITVIGGRSAKFRMPAAAVCDKEGRIYVADSGGSSVFVYEPNGIYRTAIPLAGGKPVGLALDEGRGRLYVADRNGHRVVVFDLLGKRLFEFGGRGYRDGQFNTPLDIAVDAEGRVHVLDSGNFRVQVFDADGKYLSKFGEVGDSPGMFASPKGIAIDSEGHIYVTDAAFGNFQIFDLQGRVLLHIGQVGVLPGMMNLPAGIAIDDKDRIYIADQLNSRIQEFQYMKEPEQRPQP